MPLPSGLLADLKNKVPTKNANASVEKFLNTKKILELAENPINNKTAIKNEINSFIDQFSREFDTFQENQSSTFIELNKLRMMQAAILIDSNPLRPISQDVKNLLDQRIEEIMNRPNFNKCEIGTERIKQEKNLEQARNILLEELKEEIIPLENTLKNQKKELNEFQKRVEESFMAISDKIDINDFALKKPDSREALEIVNRARHNSMEKFPKNKKLSPAKKQNKQNFDASAIKLNEINNEQIKTDNFVKNAQYYKENFSPDKNAELQKKFIEAQNKIYASIAEKYHFSPENFNSQTHQKNSDQKYEKAYEEVSQKILELKESQELNNFKSKKEEAYQNCILALKSELVPWAIKLKQLNELEPLNEKLNSSALDSVIYAVYSKAMQDQGLEIRPEDKTEFIAEINDKSNIKAYSLKPNEIGSYNTNSLLQNFGLSQQNIESIPKAEIKASTKQTKSSPAKAASNNLIFSSNAMQSQVKLLTDDELKAQNTIFDNAKQALTIAEKPKNEIDKIEIQNNVCKLIEAYPALIENAEIPREEAFIKLKNLNNMLAFIDDPSNTSLNQSSMKILDQRLEEIIKRPDFVAETNGTARYQKQKNFEAAKYILKKEIEKEAQVAKLDYEKKKEETSRISKEFQDSLMSAAKLIDLDSFSLPSLKDYAVIHKDLIFEAVEESRKNFRKKKEQEIQKTSAPDPKSKNITSFTAKKSLIPQEPSQAFKDLLKKFEGFTEEKFNSLEEESGKSLERIIKEVSQELQNDPKFKPEIFTFENYKAELRELENEPYKGGFEKVFSLHKNCKEVKEYLEYTKSMKEAKTNVLDQLKAEYTEKAIRLHQLNDSLPEDLKMNKKDLNTYITTAYSETLRKEKLIKSAEMAADKSILLQEIEHPINIKQYSGQVVADNQKKIEEMQNLLESIGISGEVVNKKEPILPIPKQITEASKFPNLNIPTQPSKGAEQGRGA